MILNHQDIIDAYSEKEIAIKPFDINNVGPNSYDVTLNNTLKVYNSKELDIKEDNPSRDIIIPENGYLLVPGILYLGRTNETATSNRYVPMFEGRSSIGRLGISTHITAGFGDVGFGYVDGECKYPTWTLEISVVQPVRIYPNIRIGQVYFLKTLSEPTFFYQGKYSLQKEAQPSMLFKDREFQNVNQNNPFNNPALDENGNFKKFSIQKDEDISYSQNSTQVPTKKEICEKSYQMLSEHAEKFQKCIDKFKRGEIPNKEDWAEATKPFSRWKSWYDNATIEIDMATGEYVTRKDLL